MNARLPIALLVMFSLLVGCASTPQAPVQLAGDSLKGTKIGIAMAPLPKTDTNLLGAGCLLCMAAASVANSTLTDYTRKLPQEDLPNLKNRLAKVLRDKGAEVVVIDEPLNLAKLPSTSTKGVNTADKDFSSIKQKYQIEKLLVVNVYMLGMVRTYANYVPTSDPKAIFKATGYIVNLKNNTYDWFLPVDVTKSADAVWDEPPKFPGLTNAYFQTLELGQDSFLKPLSE
jgi:hypothetical protein